MEPHLAVQAVVRAARPALASPAAALAFVAHGHLLAKGYVLVAAGADDVAGFESVASKSPDGSCGPDGWDARSDEFAFAYAPEGRADVRIIVRMLVVGGSLCVAASSKVEGNEREAEDPVTEDFVVSDFVPEGGQGSFVGGPNMKAYVARLEDLEARIKRCFEGPSQRKEDPRRGEGVRRGGPDDDDGLRIPGSGRNPGWNHHAPPPPAIPSVGADDLLPRLDPRHPLMSPGIGGSQVGPNDPIFFRGGGVGGHVPHPGRGLPPGARYDPIAPEGLPGFHPDDLIRGGGGGMRRRDDLDDIGMPPGWNPPRGGGGFGGGGGGGFGGFGGGGGGMFG